MDTLGGVRPGFSLKSVAVQVVSSNWHSFGGSLLRGARLRPRLPAMNPKRQQRCRDCGKKPRVDTQCLRCVRERRTHDAPQPRRLSRVWATGCTLSRSGAALLAAAVVVILPGLTSATPAQAASIPAWDLSKPCPNVLVIGARGSGQEDGKGGIPANSATLGLGPEVYGFANHLATIVASNGKGSVAVWNNTYPAIPYIKFVRGDPNLLQSVDAGVTTTRVMVAAVADKCAAATKIILAGYSQGAWVAHDGAEFVRAQDRQYIAALVLIADPGYSGADHGIGVGTAVKGRNGLVGPTGPPDFLKAKTVSVCDRGDAVCQSDPLDLYVAGGLVHTVDYQDPIIQIGTAAVVYSLLYPAAPAGGGSSSALDLVFVIDTTGSMAPYIDSTVASAQSILSSLDARHVNYRIGVVDYKDADGCADYDAVTDLSFTNDGAAIKAALASLQGKVSGGCDTPEDVLSGVDRALSLPWRNGVKKVVVQMGDAPGKDPEPHSGLTTAKVAAHALAVDPAIVDPILVGADSDAHTFDTALAAATGGQTFDATADPAGVGQVVADAVVQIADAARLQFVSFPGHVVADATSRRGAVVTFAVPELSDGTATPPAASCASARGLTSGSRFPIGDTTVTCQARASATGSTATLDFVVTVNGAPAQLANLQRAVQAMQHGTSLSHKVQAAANALRRGHVRETCSALRAVDNEVREQSRRHLTSQEAWYIRSSTDRIRAVIGC